MSKRILPDLHDQYIRDTAEKALVPQKRIFLCSLTQAVHRTLVDEGCLSPKVYITTKSVKHLYDKKPAQEYDFLLAYGHRCVKYPDRIYRNKSNKTGTVCFVKEIKNNLLFCSMELVESDGQTGYEIVTLFIVRKERYLDGYELLWEWKGGDPSS